MRTHHLISSAIVALSLITGSSFALETRDDIANGAAILQQTSKAFSQVAKKTMPATVSIKVQVLSEPQNSFPFDHFQDDFFRKFFGHMPQFQQPQQPQMRTGSGSGFIIRPNGYIVTNAHVVKDASQITVLLNDGREYPATLKGLDQRTDLAVIKIDAQDLPTLSFGDSDNLEVGEFVVAIGNPLGFEGTLTVGNVSAKGRQDLGIAAHEDFIQHTAAINPGNSGGPLLDLDGHVIGVNSAILTMTGGYMGMGLAIPSKMAEHVIEQIVDGGGVKHSYIGVVPQAIDKELADALGFAKQEGVLISEVKKDSPAYKAGLQQGDVILTYNDKPAKSISKFRSDIAMMGPGSSVRLKVLREGKPITLDVTLAQQPEAEIALSEITQKMGIDLENLTTELAGKLGLSPSAEGIIITKVKPGSPAANAGLRPGFLVTGVAIQSNQVKPVKSLDDFEQAVKEAAGKKHVILIVRHQNFQRYYTLKIG